MVFSPDATKLAWIEPATGREQPYYYLHTANLPNLSDVNSIVMGMPPHSLAWFPSGEKVLAFNAGRLGWSKKRYIEAYERIDKEMPSTFFDSYGIFELSVNPILPSKNYNIPESLLYAGNYDNLPEGANRYDR